MYFTKIQSRAKKYNKGHFWGFDRTPLTVNKEQFQKKLLRIWENPGQVPVP